jgi:copper chaperone CopZ
MSTSTDGKTAKTMLAITNTGCSFCSRVIERKLVKMVGVKDVAMSCLTDTVMVRYDPEKTTTGIIRESIKNLGYDTIERHH